MTTIIPISEDIPDDVRQQYVDVFEKHWDITKLKIVDNKELAEYDQKLDYLYLLPYYRYMYGEVANYESFTLQLYRYSESKKRKKRKAGELDKVVLGDIDMVINHLDPELPYPDTKEEMATAFGYVYTNSYEKIENMSPGLLKAYIKLLEYRLERRIYRDREYVNKAQIRKLARATLYVPKTLLYHHNTSVQEEALQKRYKDLFEDYPYTYQVMEMEELSELLLNAEEPTYVLSYVLSSPEDNVSVVEVNSGTLVYENHDSYSRSLRSMDLKRIAKSID